MRCFTTISSLVLGLGAISQLLPGTLAADVLLFSLGNYQQLVSDSGTNITFLEVNFDKPPQEPRARWVIDKRDDGSAYTIMNQLTKTYVYFPEWEAGSVGVLSDEAAGDFLLRGGISEDLTFLEHKATGLFMTQQGNHVVLAAANNTNNQIWKTKPPTA
ncbi:hypothetical protein DFQ27_009949 [Actinomortierella ambigua]|uniref:Ricin B lectin domain-containing protein n=1 Tax=Actinomortierella ambigua TaxID=1343610 RepID=A0A9P6PP66_9FUNG|nr:hypothetical protein DFQ27_009949 [Actinomortierella ambigua]